MCTILLLIWFVDKIIVNFSLDYFLILASEYYL